MVMCWVKYIYNLVSYNYIPAESHYRATWFLVPLDAQ